MAVLERSSHKILSIVEADPSSLNESTVSGLQALHLACEWPEGTKLLLDLGANPSNCDTDGRPPLYYANLTSCSKTIELLLAARRPQSFGNSDVPETVTCYLENCEAHTDNRPFYTQVIQMLAAQRKRLASYALKFLPEQVLQDLHIDRDITPDLEAMEIFTQLEAMEIFTRLKNNGHPIDRHYFGLCGHSVYEHLSYYREMQIAFDAGFRDIDCSTVKGRTVLQVLCSNNNPRRYDIKWSAFLWWHRKGVDLTRPVLCPSFLDDQIRIIHRLSLSLGGNFWVQGERSNTLFQVLEVLFDLKHLSCKDSCCCLCTLGGCTPWTNFLKAISEKYMHKRQTYVDTYKKLLDCVEKILEYIPSSGNRDSIISATIRMLLFNELGLRHLCCQYDRQKAHIKPALEKDTADEIREEDKDLVESFDRLLPTAIQQWKESSLSLWDFCEELYDRDVRPKRENVDWENVQAVQDLGVRIEAVANKTVTNKAVSAPHEAVCPRCAESRGGGL